jgi:hypothetical protein
VLDEFAAMRGEGSGSSGRRGRGTREDVRRTFTGLGWVSQGNRAAVSFSILHRPGRGLAGG